MRTPLIAMGGIESFTILEVEVELQQSYPSYKLENVWKEIELLYGYQYKACLKHQLWVIREM